MKIAFFGLQECFDYYHISGFQSFVRRLSSEITQYGVHVDYVLYKANQAREIEITPNLKLRYFRDLKDAFNALIHSSYDHIIHVRIPGYFDRLKIIFFYKYFLKKAKYHYISFTWPDSRIKRNLIFLEAKLNTKNGKILSVSPRLQRALQQRADNVHFILPPVPLSYFLRPDEKPNSGKIKITFIGVLYPAKGIDMVIETFKALQNDPRFELCICAIYEARNQRSLELRDWLRHQSNIRYIEVDRFNYTPQKEQMASDLLKATDVFIQPYTSLGSTVDMPLLLLEAMASLCAVMTTPIGSIPEIYGQSRFLFPDGASQDQILHFLKNLTHDDIAKERLRIYEQNQKLTFESSAVSNLFYEIIKA